tara:strand:+ start:333 stop:1367 length:1035 start_codon:yes stop_codon:yes gene_type:complete
MKISNQITSILETILQGNDLDENMVRTLMSSWLNDDISPIKSSAILAGLRCKRVTGLELATMANILLNACVLPVNRPDLFLVDTCGTGGDGANTFNISTAVAFVASACGVNVSKHGNRSASGKVGSADVLLNLGINLNAPLEKVINALNDIGITFLFAPLWHKSLAKLAPIRKDLGVRTVFNQLGPLVNPLRPNAQVLGVASEDLLKPMALALQKLGMQRAIVVYGYGGLDEASLEGENKIIFLENGVLNSSTVNFSDFKYKNISNKELVVSGDLTNEEILISVLNGKGHKSHISVVAFNTALVLWASGIENDLSNCLNIAFKTIEKGLPIKKFLMLKSYLEEN